MNTQLNINVFAFLECRVVLAGRWLPTFRIGPIFKEQAARCKILYVVFIPNDDP